MALEITDSNFQEILAEGKPVVMDFWLPNMAYATSLQSCSSRMESWWTSR